MKQKYGLLIVILAIVTLALLIFPMWRYAFGQSPREKAQHMACINNLHVIDEMKNRWARESHKNTNDVPSWTDLQPYFPAGFMTNCPAGGTYTIGRVNQYPACSSPDHKFEDF